MSFVNDTNSTQECEEDTFDGWLKSLSIKFTNFPDEKRNMVFENLIDASGPSQLLFLSGCIPRLVFRDFVTGLPPELSFLILQYLDGPQLLLCCMVCKQWNEFISNLSCLWRDLAEQAGADVAECEKLLNALHSDQVDFVTGRSSEQPLARFHKSLYLQALSTLCGLSNGKMLSMRNIIDKGQCRITSVNYHDGFIVTGCDDHTVQMWDPHSGTPLHTVNTHSICCLTVRGTTIYTASFNANAESWDLVTGRHKRTFCGHTSAVVAIDVTSDEAFMITGSVDRSAKLWDLRPAVPVLLRTISNIHEDWVCQVKFLLMDSHHDILCFLTCDSNVCNMSQVKSNNGEIISSYHINSEGSSKFTSFYLVPSDSRPQELFACQWQEWSKSSFLTKYTVNSNACSIKVSFRVIVPTLEAHKLYILGAGRRFAVLMCLISRKDILVMDLKSKTIVSRILTPDLCMLPRNGSTTCLCDTRWLDGLVFRNSCVDLPMFAGIFGYSQNSVLLGSITQDRGKVKEFTYDSET